jgi:hypothetical protein
MLHLFQVAFERLGGGIVLHHRKLKLHACERRPQIVADAGQHVRPLLHEARNAFPHVEESKPRAPHLGRPRRPEVRHVAPLAEGLSRVGQAFDRPDLIAQEQDRDTEQDERGSHAPQHPHMCVRRHDALAVGENVHHRPVELNANIDLIVE